jgi:ABC-2 type transport system permease protein
MKALLEFSLNRKLFNPTMVFLMIIVFVIVGVGIYSDYVVDLVFPNLFKQTMVSMPEEMATHFEFKDTKYQVSSLEKANMSINIEENEYTILADETTNEQDIMTAKSWIEQYHRVSRYPFISQEIVEQVDGLLFPSIVVDTRSVSNNEGGFVIITMIYFLMLGFSSTVANEVVSEKTSNMLEMMLTSISYKDHYIAKLLLGWLTILTQAIVWVSVFAFWLLTRIVFDQGEGLYSLLYRLQFIDKQYLSFMDHIQSMSLSFSDGGYLVLSLVFLMVGILLVQLILLLVSIKIENIEESASVQAPFYLIMLGLYYGILAINNYSHMQLGIGKVLSFVPGFSMLLMPIRILFYEVNILEVMISLTLSSVVLMAGYQLGLIYYQRHLMNSKR